MGTAPTDHPADTQATAAAALEATRGEPAQATVIAERSLTSRFAHSAPTQATARETLDVEITVFRDGHMGSAATSGAGDAALRACAARAIEAAAEASARGGTGPHPGPQPAAAPTAAASLEPGALPLDPAAAGAEVGAAAAAARSAGLDAFGVWTAAVTDTAIATTAGQAVREQATDAYMKVICRDAEGRSGFASHTAPGGGELDGTALAGRAAGICERRSGAPERRVEPGAVTAVLEPDALGTLLEMLAATAFCGLAHIEGRGALCGRLGSRVAAARVNLSDSPRFPATLQRSFDLEGVPKAPLPLIQDGVAHAVCHDRRSAALAGLDSTGHALAPGGSPEGAAPTNLVLAGGDGEDTDELVAGVERGILVTRLWYANVVRPREALVTGMTRDGTFWIEHGEIVAPVADLRFTVPVLDVLASVRELSRHPRLVSEGEFYGSRRAWGVVCPAATVDAFEVTG